MRIWNIFPLSVALLFTGCAFMQTPELNASAKTDVSLLKYKKIAVIKFKNPKDETAGQEAADNLALGFVKLGYNVVSSSQIVSLIDQGEIYTSGLTPDIKAKLKSSGIDSVVTGTVDDFFCSCATESVLPLVRQCEDNHCSVTASTRLLDLDSGEIIWAATGSDSQDGKWVTADSVLRSVVQKLQSAIPNVSQLRSAIGSTETKPPTRQPSAQSTVK